MSPATTHVQADEKEEAEDDVEVSTIVAERSQAPVAIRRIVSIVDQAAQLSLHRKILWLVAHKCTFTLSDGLLHSFSAMSFTLFLSSMDQVSVATITPTLANALDAGETISWVGTSYLIANTACQLLFGRFSDICGSSNISRSIRRETVN